MLTILAIGPFAKAIATVFGWIISIGACVLAAWTAVVIVVSLFKTLRGDNDKWLCP
ncbi:MAG: hypothetical protein J6T98_08195 [Salinivirgaceae bacterium]|nr:hypothetical protein [Salinivirgaceae bacterium]